MQIAPYLFFTGNCAEAFKAYQTILGGTLEPIMRYSDMPACDGPAPSNPDLVMHACLKFGDQMLMASDVPPEQSEGPMQSVSVSVNVKQPAEAERIFAALSEGARIKMPMSETFWAPRFGMLQDRFGTHWMIGCEAAEASSAAA
jgi:PhnB protein